MTIGEGERRLTKVLVRAHAKINLDLRVVGLRPDGYHLLKTVFQSLSLHDRLTFEACDGPFSLECSAPGVPNDERNLVWRAASALWGCAGRSGPVAGARVRLLKRVPAQGGLGGGSADAAAALVGLDALWQLGLGQARLRALAGHLGADVPFFLCGGTALGLGRGDEIYPLADLERWSVVLVFSAFGVSTPEAFGWFDQDAAEAVSPAELPASSGPPPTIALGGGIDLPLVNDLERPVSRRHPEIRALGERLLRMGAQAASMTGSGSTVFGLFAGHDAAARAAAELAAEGQRALVTTTARRRDVQRGVRASAGPVVWTRCSRIH